MARVRNATDRVANVDASEIERALRAAHNAGSITAFYDIVGMRNPSRSYFVRHGQRLHSLKAVVAYALRQERPTTTSRDFRAADAAARVRTLGFDVVHQDTKRTAERERVWLSRLARPEQTRFREKLIDLYGGCALSGCTTIAALEAAHVDPVAARGVDTLANGILLRADLHKLFDADLLAIHPKEGSVAVADIAAPDYRDFCIGLRFSPPNGGPPLVRFSQRWDAFRAVDGAA